MGLEKIKLKHSSPEWLAFRKTGLGGSDAAAILGLSPFKTNVDVWSEKVGLTEPDDISEKPAVKYGKDTEELLVKLFAIDYPQYRVRINKNVVYRRGFMFASLDAELTEKDTGRRGVLEIKTTEIHSSSQKEKWNNCVPEYYYCQCLWYLAVTGFDFVILKAQIKTTYSDDTMQLQTKHYRFERADIQSDIDYLVENGSKFWEYVQRKEQPPRILPSI